MYQISSELTDPFLQISNLYWCYENMSINPSLSTVTKIQYSILAFHNKKTFFQWAKYLHRNKGTTSRGRTEHLYCDCAPYGMQIRDRRVFSHKWSPPTELKGGKTRLRGEREGEWEREGGRSVAVALSASRQSASLRVVFVYTVVPRGAASHVFTVAGAGSVLSRPWSWTTAALRDVLQYLYHLGPVTW